MSGRDELSALLAENARLIALLESHGIEWRQSQPAAAVEREPEPSRLSAAEKVALFRRLFRGRRCLSDPLGGQDLGQDWIHARLRERVARRYL